MSMRYHYLRAPTDYTDELKRTGQRKKARAFWEYVDDVENKEENSLRFYEKSWEIGKTTVARWLVEFEHEYSRFLAAWYLINKQDKKVAGQLRDSFGTEKSHINTLYTEFEKCVGTAEVLERDKVSNLYIEEDTCANKEKNWWNDADFNDLFFIYSQNTKFVGKKEEAYEAYKRTNIDHNMLILASIQYLHDPQTVNKRFNLANFLKNDAYLPYVPKHMRVFNTETGVWKDGVYDENEEVFISNDKLSRWIFTPSRLVELFKEGKLEFVKPSGRAA